MLENNNAGAILSLKSPIDLEPSARVTKKAIQKSRNNRAAQELFTRWSNLRDASYRLTSHLTIFWPDPRNPQESLLVNCFASAIREAERALVAEGDMAEQKAFIRTITDELRLSLDLTLMLKFRSGWKPHDPAGDPLSDLIKTPNLETLLWLRTPHVAHHCKQSHLICASRVFTMRDLELAEILD